MPIQSIPHGWYSLAPTVLTTLGWLLGLFQDGCDFVRVTGDLVAQIASQPNAPYLEAGRNAYREPYYNARTDSWHTEYVGSCLVYPADHVTLDVYWNVAKGFDFASLVLGGTCSLFLWFGVCCVFSRGTWRLAGFQVLLACVFQAASFLWFQTELCQTNTCHLFWGSKADIGACIAWLLAAGFIFGHYPVPKEHFLTRVDSQDSGDGIYNTTTSRTLAPSVSVRGGDVDAYEAAHAAVVAVEATPPSWLDPQQTAEPQQTATTTTTIHEAKDDEDTAYPSAASGGQYSGEDSRQEAADSTTPTPAQIV